MGLQITIPSPKAAIYPGFSDLPWDIPLDTWSGHCERIEEEVPRGLSRHPVVFVNYDGNLYALKELPPSLAEAEYSILAHMDEMRLPCVTPVGYVVTNTVNGPASVLITRYLDNSIPYRSLFMRSNLDRYREHLLDAMAGLIMQLHLAGIYWGDCSLSNTLFRRDAGALRAYLVDAETAEIQTPRLAPALRLHDLEIMEDNVTGDLADLETLGHLGSNYPILETGSYIRQRYRSLWEEITREEVIQPDERYRIQERIRALNALGFSVNDVEIQGDESGDKLHLRIQVTDRSFHRDQLFELTGVEAGEMQARQMMNEIYAIKAYLAQEQNRSVPLSVAANHWHTQLFQPVTGRLQPIIQQRDAAASGGDPAELYCQVLEHKWFLSEQAHQDVGHQTATEDYLHRFGQSADCSKDELTN